jgi:hypothetical protein
VNAEETEILAIIGKITIHFVPAFFLLFTLWCIIVAGMNYEWQ